MSYSLFVQEKNVVYFFGMNLLFLLCYTLKELQFHLVHQYTRTAIRISDCSWIQDLVPGIWSWIQEQPDMRIAVRVCKKKKMLKYHLDFAFQTHTQAVLDFLYSETLSWYKCT